MCRIFVLLHYDDKVNINSRLRKLFRWFTKVLYLDAYAWMLYGGISVGHTHGESSGMFHTWCNKCAFPAYGSK